MIAMCDYLLNLVDPPSESSNKGVVLVGGLWHTFIGLF